MRPTREMRPRPILSSGLGGTIGGGGGSGPGSGALPWFVVTNVAYGAVGDGTTDDTDAINTAIAALNAEGAGVLYFPAGNYLVSAALTTITAACQVLGDGGSYSNPATLITQSSSTAHTFTQGAHGMVWRGIKGTRSGVTSTAGSFIHVAVGDRGHYEDISADLFWVNIDFDDGGEWSMTNCNFNSGVKYAARIRHTDLPDGGDWSITGCLFGATNGSDALIRYESGGGGKIVGCKFNGATSLPVLGIDVAIPTGVQTAVLTITGCSIENTSSHGIKITTTGTGRFGAIAIVGNQFGLYTSTTGRAVYISAASAGGAGVNGGIGNVVIDGIVARTNSTDRAAVELVNTDSVTLGDFSLIDSFTSRYTSSGDTNTIDGGSVAGLDFDDLGDVTITAVEAGEMPRWDGSAWVNDTGMICVDPGTLAIDDGDPFGLTLTSVWGIDGGTPYYDDANVDAGDEAALFYDPLTDNYTLVAYDF